MASAENRGGCLSVFLQLIGIDLARRGLSEASSPYRLRDDFLSASERSFFGVLHQAISGRAYVLAKVRVADLLYVPRGAGSLAHQNRISAKHVDFVLCAPNTLQPLAAIELDDASHERSDRIERDDFLDEAFRAANLPLLRFPARRLYDLKQVSAKLEEILSQPETPIPGTNALKPDGIPNCPKCNARMVLRIASKSQNRGEQFYGCPNYPQCRGIVRIS